MDLDHWSTAEIWQKFSMEWIDVLHILIVNDAAEPINEAWTERQLEEEGEGETKRWNFFLYG